MTSFAKRFGALAALRSPFCVGLDPSQEVLRAWGLKDDPAGLREFCARVLDIACDTVAAFKPHAGFFERFGPDGLVEMANAIAMIHARGRLVILNSIGVPLDLALRARAWALRPSIERHRDEAWRTRAGSLNASL